MDFNVSSDKRYLQLENQIVDLETGMKFELDTAHPAIVCEMFKHQFAHSYKMKLMETTDLFSKMKQLIYPFLNHNKDLVSEYEVRYGMNLIYESSDDFNYGTYRTIEESWDFVKTKVLEVFPVTPTDLFEDSWVGDLWNKGVNAVKKGAEWVGDKLKQAGQFILNKGLPWFFEKLESFLLSPVGIGIDVALTALGIGKVASALLWGSLGIWKIYQLFTGKIPNEIWSYIDIAICLVGLVFTGGAAKGMKAAVKGLGRDTRALAKSPVLKQIVQLIGKGLNFIMNAILKPIEWLAKTLGGPRVQEIINVAKSRLKDVFVKLESATNPAKQPGLRKTLQKGLQKDIVNPAKNALKGKGPVSVGKALGKGTTWGLATHGAMKGIEKAAGWYGEKQVEKQTQQAKQALTQLASDENVMKQTVSISLGDALKQMEKLDNQ